jgi:hypothetical protein
VVNTPARLDRVLEELARAGLNRQQIKVFAGEAGIRTIDPKGVHHGLLGRLTRVLQGFGDEREHMERYEQELRAGHFIVAVSTPDDPSKGSAREAFRVGGGHFVDYYGPLVIEHLVA